MAVFRTEEFLTETENGSVVRIKRDYHGKTHAWGMGWYEDFAFIDVLNGKDLELIEGLGFPRWYFDYTGKGMVLPLHKQEYVAIQLKENLKIKTPYHEYSRE